MWNNLDSEKKKAISIIAMVIVLYIAYNFSFSKAIEAIKLNHQLTRNELATQSLDVSYPQIESKAGFYSATLKLYQVKKDDYEDRLWQNVSSIAISKNIKISFNPIPPSSSDTAGQPQQVIMQEFNFKGGYFNCVSLLDSLNKTRGIGMISAIKLSVQREAPNTTELALQVTLSLIIK